MRKNEPIAINPGDNMDDGEAQLNDIKPEVKTLIHLRLRRMMKTLFLTQLQQRLDRNHLDFLHLNQESTLIHCFVHHKDKTCGGTLLSQYQRILFTIRNNYTKNQ